MDIDICMFKGHLGSKPKAFTTNSGQQVVNISLALNKDFYSKLTDTWVKKTIWKQLVFWDKNAELIEKKGFLGAYLFVECSSDENVFTDSKGNKKTVPTYKVKSFDVLIKESTVNKTLQNAWEEKMTDHYLNGFSMDSTNQNDQIPPR